MRILVFGAGVIGRIYAGRLAAAGHEIFILSRGAATDDLRTNGIRLVREGDDDVVARPRVIETLADAGHVDLALVTVRLDQMDAALPQLASLNADCVASLINLPLGTERLAQAIGADRFVPAFSGVAGRLGADGTVHYVQVPQQPTVVGPGLRRKVVRSALELAQFPIADTKDMDAWLKTHSIFVSAFESALVAVAGDAHALASDSAAVRELILAVRDGFVALRNRGVTITPGALRIIFQTMPVWFSARYWRRQLDGDLGSLALAPAALASQHSELPAMQRDVRTLLGGIAPPRLERLFANAG